MFVKLRKRWGSLFLSLIKVLIKIDVQMLRPICRLHICVPYMNILSSKCCAPYAHGLSFIKGSAGDGIRRTADSEAHCVPSSARDAASHWLLPLHSARAAVSRAGRFSSDGLGAALASSPPHCHLVRGRFAPARVSEGAWQPVTSFRLPIPSTPVPPDRYARRRSVLTGFALR